jgi:hypothetical protein
VLVDRFFDARSGTPTRATILSRDQERSGLLIRLRNSAWAFTTVARLLSSSAHDSFQRTSRDFPAETEPGAPANANSSDSDGPQWRQTAWRDGTASASSSSDVRVTDGFGNFVAQPCTVDLLDSIASPAAFSRALRRGFANWRRRCTRIRMGLTKPPAQSGNAWAPESNASEEVYDLPPFSLVLLGIVTTSAACIGACINALVCLVGSVTAAFFIPWYLSAAVYATHFQAPGDVDVLVGKALLVLLAVLACRAMAHFLLRFSLDSTHAVALSGLQPDPGSALWLLKNSSPAIGRPHGMGSSSTNARQTVHVASVLRPVTRAVESVGDALETRRPDAALAVQEIHTFLFAFSVFVSAFVVLCIIHPLCAVLLPVHAVVVGLCTAPALHICSRRVRKTEALWNVALANLIAECQPATLSPPNADTAAGAASAVVAVPSSSPYVEAEQRDAGPDAPLGVPNSLQSSGTVSVFAPPSGGANRQHQVPLPVLVARVRRDHRYASAVTGAVISAFFRLVGFVGWLVLMFASAVFLDQPASLGTNLGGDENPGEAFFGVPQWLERTGGQSPIDTPFAVAANVGQRRAHLVLVAGFVTIGVLACYRLVQSASMLCNRGVAALSDYALCVAVLNAEAPPQRPPIHTDEGTMCDPVTTRRLVGQVARVVCVLIALFGILAIVYAYDGYASLRVAIRTDPEKVHDPASTPIALSIDVAPVTGVAASAWSARAVNREISIRHYSLFTSTPFGALPVRSLRAFLHVVVVEVVSSMPSAVTAARAGRVIADENGSGAVWQVQGNLTARYASLEGSVWCTSTAFYANSTKEPRQSTSGTNATTEPESETIDSFFDGDEAMYVAPARLIAQAFLWVRC